MTTPIDYDALISESANCLRHDAMGDSTVSLIISLNETIRALRAAAVESERDAARFKHLVANGVGWSDGSPHLTRRDSALRDIDKTRAEIDKAMAAQEKAKHPAGGAE